MSDAIIVALITAAASIACQIIISKKNFRENSIQGAVKDQQLADRLDRLEEKIDIHNGYAEKFGVIETDIAVIKNELQNLEKRG